MFPNVEGYKTYQIIQSTKFNKSTVQSNINSYIELGWDIIGVMHLNEVEFTQLGWLTSKGDPAYPIELESDNNH